MTIICQYCTNHSRLTDGTEIYPHSPDLAEKKFYYCKPCDAITGCHKGTETPLGTLANKPTRKARTAAHAVFDEVWKSKAMSRSDAYVWLASQLKLTAEQCHIGMFDSKTCWAAVEAVKQIDLSAIPKAKAFKCEHCNKRFKERLRLFQHRRNAHKKHLVAA